MASSASGDTDSGVDVTTAVGAPVAVLALIAVVLRFWTRYFTRAGFRWDDWMILVALLGTIGTDAMVLAGLLTPVLCSYLKHDQHYRPGCGS